MGERKSPHPHVVAKYDYDAQEASELTIRKGERLTLLDDSRQWWQVESADRRVGFVPSNFVKRSRPSILSVLKNTLTIKRRSDCKRVRSDSRDGSRPGGSIPVATLKNSSSDGRINYTSSGPGPGGRAGASSARMTISAAVAKFSYSAKKEDELSLQRGDRVCVVEKSNDGWWKGRKMEAGGKGWQDCGWFPSNYVLEEVANDGVSGTFGRSGSANLLNGGRKGKRLPVSPDSSFEFTVDGRDSSECIIDNDNGIPLNETNDRLDSYCPKVDRTFKEGLEGSHDRTATSRPLALTLGRAGPRSEPDSGVSQLSMTPESLPGDLWYEGHSVPEMRDDEVCRGANREIETMPLGFRKTVGGPFSDRSWYFGNVSRNHCEDLLNKYGRDGDFVLRDSETNVGDYTITLKAPRRNKHFRVHALRNDSGACAGYCIGQQCFVDMDTLIEHYKKHAIYRQGDERLTLVRSFILPESY